jgi:hypothetical protein
MDASDRAVPNTDLMKMGRAEPFKPHDKSRNKTHIGAKQGPNMAAGLQPGAPDDAERYERAASDSHEHSSDISKHSSNILVLT